MTWPALSSCRLKFKICPEPWPAPFHSPRSSRPWAVTPVMLYKCQASRDWWLPWKRRAFGLRALSQREPFVGGQRPLAKWTMVFYGQGQQRKRHQRFWAILSACKLILKGQFIAKIHIFLLNCINYVGMINIFVCRNEKNMKSWSNFYQCDLKVE